MPEVMDQTYLVAGPARLAPDCPIQGANDANVGDFWTWAYSDVLSNRNRSIFAEFLVGAALDITKQAVRTEWNAYDLAYRGRRIEVKSAAYAQSWKQRVRSLVKFDVAPKRAWIAATNEYHRTPTRFSDCYVFCLFTAVEDAYARVLDVNVWEFYPVSTAEIERRCLILRSLSLARLRTIAPAVSFEELRSAVDGICDQTPIPAPEAGLDET